MDENKLPQWAQDRLDAERKMGKLESNASPGTIAVGLFVIALELTIIVVVCVVIYVIGKAVVG